MQCSSARMPACLSRTFSAGNCLFYALFRTRPSATTRSGMSRRLRAESLHETSVIWVPMSFLRALMSRSLLRTRALTDRAWSLVMDSRAPTRIRSPGGAFNKAGAAQLVYRYGQGGYCDLVGMQGSGVPGPPASQSHTSHKKSHSGLLH
jgi:hypothetical protein